MNGIIKKDHEDRVWEAVLHCLSDKGRLSRFYKIPRHEMNGILKNYSRFTPADLSYVIALTNQNKIAERDAFLDSLDEYRVFSMLLTLGRSMKCWIETEGGTKATKRWQVANS